MPLLVNCVKIFAKQIYQMIIYSININIFNVISPNCSSSELFHQDWSCIEFYFHQVVPVVDKVVSKWKKTRVGCSGLPQEESGCLRLLLNGRRHRVFSDRERPRWKWSNPTPVCVTSKYKPQCVERTSTYLWCNARKWIAWRGLQAYMQPAATESDRTKVSPDCLILPSPRQLHNQPLSKHSPSWVHPHSSSFKFQQICFFCALPQK